MDLNSYQARALSTQVTRDAPQEFFHLVLGLVGEAGEVAEKVKKWVRDEGADPTRLDRAALKKELGDVLWYAAVLADHLGYTLEEVAQLNVDKLADRMQRGVLQASGDER